jgi:hypothetical protein
MATVNHYFQSGKTIGRTSEHNLYEDLIIESMKIYGFEVYYIPRKSFDLDPVFTEDPLNTYEHAYPIEMYMEDIMGYTGQGDFLTKFGLETRDSANFVVSRKRWKQLVGASGNTILERPTEGDLIFFPLTNAFFEIRKVDGQSPFFQLGKLFVYKMNCELMQFSNERITTGVEEIDEYAAQIDQSIADFEMLLESGDSLLLEDFEDTALVLESYLPNDNSSAGINDALFGEAGNILDFSEKNPFGEVYK